LHGFLVAESGGAVQWRFALGAAIAHEGASFYAGARGYIGIGPGRQEHTQDQVVVEAMRCRKSRMKRGFACLCLPVIYIRPLRKQKFREAPVTVEAGGAQAQIVAERSQGGSAAKKEFDGAHIAVVGAVGNQRDAFINGRGGPAVSEILEDHVGAAGRDFVQQGHGVAS